MKYFDNDYLDMEYPSKVFVDNVEYDTPIESVMCLGRQSSYPWLYSYVLNRVDGYEEELHFVRDVEMNEKDSEFYLWTEPFFGHVIENRYLVVEIKAQK